MDKINRVNKRAGFLNCDLEIRVSVRVALSIEEADIWQKEFETERKEDPKALRWRVF